jgi:hypothetical protein
VKLGTDVTAMKVDDRGIQSADAERLLNALIRPGNGLIELRALPSKARTFVLPGDISAIVRFVSYHQYENVYFGVAARKNATNGTLANCTVLNCLFADLDFKAFPSLETARSKLKQFPLRPSYIVNSGGGLHCYWMLRHPIDLQERAAEAKALLRRLTRAIGADIDAAEPARILRIPGTYNHKYDPPRLVTLE